MESYLISCWSGEYDTTKVDGQGNETDVVRSVDTSCEESTTPEGDRVVAMHTEEA